MHTENVAYHQAFCERTCTNWVHVPNRRDKRRQQAVPKQSSFAYKDRAAKQNVKELPHSGQILVHTSGWFCLCFNDLNAKSSIAVTVFICLPSAE